MDDGLKHGSNSVCKIGAAVSLCAAVILLSGCSGSGSSSSNAGSSSSTGSSGSSLAGTVGTATTTFVYSPYFYSGDYNSVLLTTGVNGSSVQLVQVMPSKLTTVTWAFATGSCGAETWTGVSAAQFAATNVANFVGAGKKYIVSTGGAGANFTCTSDADFATFIQTYQSANLIGFDFDIENTQSQTDVDNLVQRVVAAQQSYPGLRYSFTVSSLGGNQGQSLDHFGVMVMNAIHQYGLGNYTINLEVMDYANSGAENASLCAIGSNGMCNMGQSAINAAENLHNNWSVPYAQIELTPMIGGNDDYDEIFTLADVTTLSAYALQKGLGGVHFWAFERDRDCAPVTVDNNASDLCNNYGQAGTLAYTNAFLQQLGQ
jgi:chitinase